MTIMPFSLKRTVTATSARRGTLELAHGTAETPVFMPVGTQATVKAMTPDEVADLGFPIILGNTYHLFIRPGTDIIQRAGGLHRFMGWPRSILTDSGGYQVFSLSKLRKLKPDGVEFQSHVDGNTLFLGPVEAMRIQRELGSDIAMVFDECTPYPCSRADARESMELTLKWAKVCREQPRADGQQVFGIVQGGMYPELRSECAAKLVEMDFDGYAVGGLSVGEPENEMMATLEAVTPELPTDKPRYMMGVGTPPQIVNAVAHGIDMFDCVLPTRLGRNGSAYTANGVVPIKAGRFKDDLSPIEDGCECYACRTFTKAYVRHLLNTNEILGHRLMTQHNLHFYAKLMRDIRHAIDNGSFADFQREFCSRYVARV